MKKKLLAGIMALALCSTSIPQMIFAEEFTSGVLEETTPEETEEIPEVFTDENQAAAGDEIGGVSEFSSEEVPEFDDESDNAAVATDGGDTTATSPIEISINSPSNPSDPTSGYTYDSSTSICTINKPGSYRFTGNGETSNRIVIDNITSGTVNIYLNNVSISTDVGPALLINQNVTVQVYIHLEGTNTLKTTSVLSAALQKDNLANLTIDNAASNSTGNTGSLTAAAAANSANGAGIGGGANGNGNGSNITISGGSVIAYSNGFGSGIGGGAEGNGSGITISGGLVKAYSNGFGSGIGGGYNGNSNNIYISGGSVKAQTLDYTPVKSANENISVYRYDISNPDRSNIGIDGNNWTPSIHSDNDKTLYAWLTGEDHYITVGSEKKAYIFDSASETFSNTKRTLSSSDFQFAAPENLTYNNCVKSATVEVKNGIKGVENITVKYFLGDTLVSDPINVGTYTVKIDVDGSDFNNPTQNLTDENWTFTISRGSISNSSIEITPYSGTYDGNPHEIISSITGYPGGSTIEYSTDNSNWQSNCPTVTSVDDATNTSVFVRVSNSNYNPWSSSTPLKAKITPKKITIAIDGKEKKYGEDNPGFTFKLQDSTQLIGEDTKDSLGVKLATTANNSSPVTDNGYPISVESWTNTNYDIIASNGTLTIKKSNQTPNLPKPTQTQKSVLWSCKKVSDITGLLPEHWNWADSSKELQVGANSVTAVYTGKDKGNYETEAVIYTITRENCNHPHTVDRYYSSASCTSSGYSGDTYCTDCGALVSYGYTISAYGHSYDDGVITTEPTTETEGTAIYTCKRCKHQETRTLGKLNDGEPYIEGDFLKKGWDSVREIIKKSKEKDLVSITLNGAQTLPVSVLSELKGKDIDLSLNMENGFIWKINGTLITAEAPADVDLSVAKATDYIPASLYKLISTNQNDFAFHLGASGAFNFPMVLSVKADASCAGLMANLFWYDAQSQVLQCIQSVTVSGALERSIPYADFTLSKGQDYFVVFATESFNGKSIHMDGSITDENGIATFSLGYGKYFYHEIAAPEEYIIDDTLYPFEITEEGVSVYALSLIHI